jgi:hypothetical protein
VEFIQNLYMHEKKKSLAVAFVSIYIDDDLPVNNDQFHSHFDLICDSELEIKITTEFSTSASYLDILLKLEWMLTAN